MNSKIVFLVLAAFITNQVTASAVPKLNSTIDDIIEVAEQVLLFVNKLVNDAVDGALYLLNSTIDSLDEIKANAVNLTQNLIQREQDIINQLIDATKKQVNASGLDILECVESVEEQQNAITIENANLSMVCIDKAIEESTTVFLQILGDVKEINADFKTQEEKLGTCKGQLIPVDCVKEVIAGLGEIAATVPAKAQEEGQKALQALDALGSALETCGKNAADSAQGANIAVFNTFSQCVWDKMNNSTLIN